ncbi:MAG: hypothetical protein ACE147_04165 [Candidatus Methylomirabilales bacterium]
MSEATDAPRRAPAGSGGDLVIPAVGAAFAAYYLWTVWDLSWEAKADGLVVGLVLLVLIALLVARVGLAVAAGRARLGLDALVRPVRPQLTRLALLAAILAFILTLGSLGFTLGVFLFMCAAMLILGVRSPGALVGVAAGVALSGWLLFILFLDTRFPRGPIEQLLARLF